MAEIMKVRSNGINSLHEINLVEDQYLRLRHFLELFDDRPRLVIEALLGIDEQRRKIGIGRARQRSRHHRPVEPPLRRKDAGRIDEYDLRLVLDRDAPHEAARRLHLGRDDRHLRADQRVEQRRFAGIRSADERDETASHILSLSHRVRHRAG
jgi:hypothetical protein